MSSAYSAGLTHQSVGMTFPGEGGFPPDRYGPDYSRGGPGGSRYAGNSQQPGQPMGDQYASHYSYAQPHYMQPVPRYSYPGTGHERGGVNGGDYHSPPPAPPQPQHYHSFVQQPPVQPGYGPQIYASNQPGLGAPMPGNNGLFRNRMLQNSNRGNQPSHRGLGRGNRNTRRFERFNGSNLGGQGTFQHLGPNNVPNAKSKRKGNSKKKEGNILGLTPNVDEDGIVTESEEEVDEEVAFALKDGVGEE